MRILALDLGTLCGWAVGTPGGLYPSGVLDLRPRRFEGAGMRFVKFQHELNRLLLICDRVVCEEVRRHLGTDAAHVYGGLLAVLQAECEQRKIPYSAVPVQTIKKHATGKGNADKAAMLAAARQRWPACKDDNEADALWLLDYALMDAAQEEAR